MLCGLKNKQDTLKTGPDLLNSTVSDVTGFWEVTAVCKAVYIR